MSDLDLIPNDYRQLQRLRWQVKLYIFILLTLVTVIIAGKLSLKNIIDEKGNNVADYESKQYKLEMQQQQLNTLKNEKNKLDEKVTILRSLRNGPAAETMFIVIDHAYVDGTWFKRWYYQNGGDSVTLKNREVPESGYFIIIKDDDNPNKHHAYILNTNMEISGQAMSHTNLSELVNNLISTKEIDDVKILNTSLNKINNNEVVNFDLSITVNTQYRSES
jgi:Fimbrial assembly protein (PilN)